jgi:anti-sigma regulatory factor (Ser/Thr protein kinase)
MTPAVGQVQLDARSNAPFLARRLVRGLASDLDPVQFSDASLAITELVTNAFRHGRGPIGLRVESARRWLRAEVVDQGDGFPANQVAGNGLGIVGAVSEAWGAARGPTRVWFEIGRRD